MMICTNLDLTGIWDLGSKHLDQIECFKFANWSEPYDLAAQSVVVLHQSLHWI